MRFTEEQTQQLMDLGFHFDISPETDDDDAMMTFESEQVLTGWPEQPTLVGFVYGQMGSPAKWDVGFNAGPWTEFDCPIAGALWLILEASSTG